MTKKYSNINGCHNSGTQNTQEDSRRNHMYKQVHYDKVHSQNYSNNYVQRNKNKMSQGGDSSENFRHKHSQNERSHYRRANVVPNCYEWNIRGQRYKPNEVQQSQYNQHQNPRRQAELSMWRQNNSENDQTNNRNIAEPVQEQRWTTETASTRTEETPWKLEVFECPSPTVKKFLQDESKFDAEAVKRYFKKKTLDAMAQYQQEQERKQAAGIVTEIDKVMNDLAATRSTRSPIQSLQSLFKFSSSPPPSQFAPSQTATTIPSPLVKPSSSPIDTAIATSTAAPLVVSAKFPEPLSSIKPWKANASPKTTNSKFSPKLTSTIPPSSTARSYIPAAYQIITTDGFYYQAAPAFIPFQSSGSAAGTSAQPQMMVLVPPGTAPPVIPIMPAQPHTCSPRINR